MAAEEGAGAGGGTVAGVDDVGPVEAAPFGAADSVGAAVPVAGVGPGIDSGDVMTGSGIQAE